MTPEKEAPKRQPRFLGLATTSGPQRLIDNASVAVDRNLASERVDFVPVTDLQLLQFIEDASTYLRQKAERADA